MFTEGKMFAVLEFEIPLNDSVQPDFVLDLG